MATTRRYVIFRNSEHLSGNLAKKTLGDGCKSGLIYVLLTDFGFAEASRIMNRIAKLCSNYLGGRGLSIGIEDVTPPEAVANAKESALREAFSQAETFIQVKPRDMQRELPPLPPIEAAVAAGVNVTSMLVL